MILCLLSLESFTRLHAPGAIRRVALDLSLQAVRIIASNMRWFLWLLAVITRLCLLLSPIRDQMSSRVEVSTPVTSFTRMKEGAYLWELGASPYSGDVLHQPPILLFLCKYLYFLEVIHDMLGTSSKWSKGMRMRYDIRCEEAGKCAFVKN